MSDQVATYAAVQYVADSFGYFVGPGVVMIVALRVVGTIALRVMRFVQNGV